jgi:hypothetical protein
VIKSRPRTGITQLFFNRHRRANADLDRLGSFVADAQVVHLFYIICDRVVEFVAGTLNRVEATMPPRLITATSIVPPPMSTTILPRDSWIGIPAPIAASTDSLTTYALRAPARIAASTTARRSVEVTPVGTETITSGLKKLILAHRFADKIFEHRLRHAIIGNHPVFERTIRDDLAGVRPIISLASAPTAKIRLSLSLKLQPLRAR